MAVTLTRKPFSKEERDVVVTAVMTGICPAELPELAVVADEIAMAMPELLRRAKWPDTSDNRRLLIRIVMARYGVKAKGRSSSYRRLAR